MDEDLEMKIAALVEGRLSEEEEDRLYRELASEPSARDLLLSMHREPVHETPSIGLPFRIASIFQAGVCEDFIRLYRLEGSQLGGSGARRFQNAIGQISGGVLPVCFRKRVDLEPDSISHIRQIGISLKGSLIEFEVDLDTPDEFDDYIEIWQNGALVHTYSASANAPNPQLQPGGAVAIRHASSETGISLRLAPVAFRIAEWLSASLTCGLRGEFAEAVGFLRRDLLWEGFPQLEVLRKASSQLEALRAFTRVDESVLSPLPATRSTQITDDQRKEALRPVWEGIITCWPEARNIKNPWTPLEGEGSSPSSLPPHIQGLVQGTIQTGSGEAEPLVSHETSDDPIVKTGWAALRGWNSLLAQDFKSSLEHFESVSPSEQDPFGLKQAVSLAKHLLTLQDPTCTEERREDSSNAVWRGIIEEILAQTETQPR